MKTNRREGASPARLHGELTAVSVRMPSTSNAATSRSEDIARGRHSRSSISVAFFFSTSPFRSLRARPRAEHVSKTS